MAYLDDSSMDRELNTWENEGGSAMRNYSPAGKPVTKHMNQLDAMVAWELGNISEGEAIYLFQTLVDNGLAWRLQAMYGRQAMRLIEGGLIVATTTAQPRANGYSIQDVYAGVPFESRGIYD